MIARRMIVRIEIFRDLFTAQDLGAIASANDSLLRTPWCELVKSRVVNPLAKSFVVAQSFPYLQAEQARVGIHETW